MKRDYLIEKYEKFGENWQINLLKRELKRIDDAESKDKALGHINSQGEYWEDQTGNLSLTESELDKCSDRSHM